MSGPSFWEFLLLCMIGLIVLGPKRLPQVANQIGSWIGHARRMTRTLKRQLEEELELDKPRHMRPPVPHTPHAPPRDDDTFSPVHDQPAVSTAAAGAPANMTTNTTTDTPADAPDDRPADVPGAASADLKPDEAAADADTATTVAPDTDSEERKQA